MGENGCFGFNAFEGLKGVFIRVKQQTRIQCIHKKKTHCTWDQIFSGTSYFLDDVERRNRQTQTATISRSGRKTKSGLRHEMWILIYYMSIPQRRMSVRLFSEVLPVFSKHHIASDSDNTDGCAVCVCVCDLLHACLKHWCLRCPSVTEWEIIAPWRDVRAFTVCSG